MPPIAPDFVLELISPSDTLTITQAKMHEYIDHGMRLGWLINHQQTFAKIHRPHQPIIQVESP